MKITYLGEAVFKNIDLNDKVLTVVCDIHYTGNASQRNLATD